MPGLPERAGLIGYFTRHPTAANLLMVLLVVLGLAAAPNLRAQFLPDVAFDDVLVTVEWEGASPEDVDRAIAGPLTPALRAVAGIHEIESVATEGQIRFEIEFEPGWNMERARSEVDAALASVTDLPEDAEEPEVRRESWRDRVTDVVITGPVGVDQLARFADRMVLALFEAGVTRTTLSGIADPETRIVVESRSLLRHDLTLAEIAAAVGTAAQSAPAGALDAAGARVRSGSERRSADAIAGVVLRSDPDGTTLRVADVARVEVGAADRETALFVGSDPAVSIQVQRTASGDAIALQRAVERAAASLEAELPPEVRIDLIRTRSEAITGRLSILLDNGLTGLALVLALLFLFLSARTAFWVAAGLPVAMLTAVAIMYAAGVTLNMVSLFGLIITLGIVVDDAIVVGEHADFRARRLGEPPVLAAERAARRMALPVVSATLTTIIAFFALWTIGGRFGDLILDIPVTVIAVLAASLVECFLILPHLMSHALAHTARTHWYDWPSRLVNRGFRWLRERFFRPLMWVVIRARYPVIAGAILLLASQIALFISGDVTWRFWNAPERGSVTVSFALADGASRSDTVAQMEEVQRAVAMVGDALAAEHGRDPVDYVLAQVGGAVGRGLSVGEDKDADLLGSVQVELIDADLRPYSSFDVVDALRREITSLPGTEEISYTRWRSGPGGDGLSVSFRDADPDRLKVAAEALKRAVAGYPEITSVADDMPFDKEQLVVDLTPRAQVLGFAPETLGRVLRDRLNGIEATSFSDGPRSATIRVELPEAEKTADFLQRTLIRAPSGQFVPLADLVTVSRSDGFAQVRRVSGVQVVEVTGDLDQDDAARAAEILETLRSDILPDIAATHQVGWQLTGLAEQERAFLGDAALGFALCLLGIFLTLTWIFGSWSRPLAIMAIIPFGLVGTIWGHYLWDVPLSMFTVVGLIGMTGIIINDSIVLITTVNEYGRTRALYPAIVDAVCDRLRPVLLTTLTTVLGLAPLLYETSQQAQFLKPTVITLVYGLGFGLLLVLLAVPALLAVGQDVTRSFGAARRATTRRRTGKARAAALALAAVLALWGALTVGSHLVRGEMLLPLGLPALPAAGAFGVFAAGGIVLTLIALAVTALSPHRGAPRDR